MREGRLPRASSQQIRRLKQFQRTSSDSRVVRRTTVLLMLLARYTIREICRLSGLSRRGVEKIRSRWDKSNLASLLDRPHTGRPPKADEAFRRRLIKTVEVSPLRWGYGFTVWNTDRLAEHLFRETRIRISPRRIRQLLKEEGYSFGVPAHTLKGKRPERQHRHAKKRLLTLKKGLCGPILVFASASGTKAVSTCTRT